MPEISEKKGIPPTNKKHSFKYDTVPKTPQVSLSFYQIVKVFLFSLEMIGMSNCIN
jgi:hypothetical protein